MEENAMHDYMEKIFINKALMYAAFHSNRNDVKIPQKFNRPIRLKK